MTTTSVDESISVTVSEPPVDATSGVLPMTLARLTGEFLDFVNILADTDPSDAAALAELEALLNRSVAAIQDKTRGGRGSDPRVRGAGRRCPHRGGANCDPRAGGQLESSLVAGLPAQEP